MQTRTLAEVIFLLTESSLNLPETIQTFQVCVDSRQKHRGYSGALSEQKIWISVEWQLNSGISEECTNPSEKGANASCKEQVEGFRYVIAAQ